MYGPPRPHPSLLYDGYRGPSFCMYSGRSVKLIAVITHRHLGPSIMLARQVAERVACLAREDAEVGYDLSNGRHVHARYQNTADLQTMPCADRSW